MTKIESRTSTLKKTQEEVYLFLEDFNNFNSLMPPQITNWKSDQHSCSFTIQGMASLGMKFETKTPSSELVIVPDGKVPFQFKMYIHIGNSDNKATLKLILEAELNAMMKMMAEKPLQNFLDLLIKGAENIF